MGRMWSRLVDEERGDVPGWVLVTLMTAGLSVPSEVESKPRV